MLASLGLMKFQPIFTVDRSLKWVSSWLCLKTGVFNAVLSGPADDWCYVDIFNSSNFLSDPKHPWNVAHVCNDHSLAMTTEDSRGDISESPAREAFTVL